MRELTVSRSLRWLLGFQAFIALALVVGDLGGAYTGSPFRSADAPSLDQPIRPGDQRRQYDPSGVPGDPARREAMPGGETYPDRLSILPEGDSLVLRGTIAAGDGTRVAELLASRSIETVTLDSPGGSVMDALEIGRAIRAADASSAIASGGVCFSACPYMLAGGVTRDVPRSSRVGVHQHYFGENSLLPAFLAVEDVQRGQGMVMAFLDEMGVDPLLMQHALTTPPEEIYVLIPEELERYRLAFGG